MFKIITKTLLVFLLSLPVIVLLLAITDEPQTNSDLNLLSENQVNDLQQLLIDHDPRLFINNRDQTIQLTEREINALLSYFKSYFSDKLNLGQDSVNLEDLHINVLLTSGKAQIDVSLPLPNLPFGNYLNYSLMLVQNQDSITLDSLIIGNLPIPALFYHWIAPVTHNVLQEENNYQLIGTLFDSVQQISLMQNSMSITLDWQVDSIENIRNQARQAFISSEEVERLKSYNDILFEVVDNFPEGVTSVNLHNILKPMFGAAVIRSNDGANAISENRAIFIILTTYLTELRLEHLIGESLTESAFKTPRQLNVTAGSRRDLAQHIVGSAAITASSNASMANILSIYKEVHDSRYRSGFSFSDLTANEVGTLLGSYASENIEQALKLQIVIMEAQSEAEYMPSVLRLDGLSEEEFLQIYDSRNSPAFLQRVDEIKAEIIQLPLFQKMLP